MTKELVEEAIGRPPEETAILKEAKEALGCIESAKRNMAYYENKKKEEEKKLELAEKELELLRQGKYVVKKSE